MDFQVLIEKSAKLLPNAIGIAQKISKWTEESISYDFRIAHNKYCESVVRKYCRARTFFVRDQPQYLDEFYVPSSIIGPMNSVTRRAEIATLGSERAIIMGSGGSGKTIFMRYLLLNSIESGAGYPVFIELRNLKDDQYSNIELSIFEFMSEHGFPLGNDYARKSLKDGLLTILLDGFDEVPSNQRKNLERSIRKMASGSKSRIIISSRPDTTLDGWEDFSTCKIAPLELDEACELIDRIRYEGEEEVKLRFVSALRAGLFTSHQHFLSNPLLLSIMLLTYGDSADIPKKFASFYEQAYIALFQKHDALKSGYRRERKTELDLYEFSRIFSAFCAISYMNKDIRFTQIKAIATADQAKTVSGIDKVKPSDFLDDARQAVCLLIEEGLDLTFVHRSFQEYFVARFIIESSESIQISYIKSITSDQIRSVSDNVINILHEMSPQIVEDHYLIPTLNQMFGEDKNRKLSKQKWISIYKKLFRSINVTHNSMSYGFNQTRIFPLTVFMRRLCDCAPSVRDEEGLQLLSDAIKSTKNPRSINVSNLATRSPLWTKIAKVKNEFGPDVIEKMRVELLAMEKRASIRKTVADEIFSFT